jgi:hypothetical protein
LTAEEFGSSSASGLLEARKKVASSVEKASIIENNLGGIFGGYFSKADTKPPKTLSKESFNAFPLLGTNRKLLYLTAYNMQQ